MATKPITLLHIVYRFDIGGLEMVMVNLINSLSEQQFKHIIVSLTDANPAMIAALKPNYIDVIELHKPLGNDFKIHYQLWQLFRNYCPDIVHSYNLATLEYQFIAFLARVPLRIHAEHGRDIYDLDGSNKKYQWLRRLLNPFIHYWVPVSQELASWLINTVTISKHKVKLIYNGIDLARYQPLPKNSTSQIFTIGTVGRAAAVKNQLALIKAVESLLQQHPKFIKKMQLIIVGDGELLPQMQAYVDERHLQNIVHFLGARNDVADLLSQFDLFVLPSLAEGIALTILEAMASGLPVIATQVGGNPELIEPAINGQLIPVQNEQALIDAILYYLEKPQRCQQHGNEARQKVEGTFSLQTMTKHYIELYRLF